MAEFIFHDSTPKRVDIYIQELNLNLSRSYLSKQIEFGLIKVNNKISKPSLKLREMDKITIDDTLLEPHLLNKIELPIIYEDNFCIVINKPSGIITHAKGRVDNEASVASFIRDKIDPNLTGNRAGIVHRLDRGTSGIIICAKNEYAQKYLQRQFAKRMVEKQYIALVTGKMEEQQANILFPIERNPKKPSRFRVGINGKTAQTYYDVIKSNESYSLLLLTPKTGRTHQLRVHLKAINHPIVGDLFYDGKPYKRLMLHASFLSVILPDIGRIEFNAPLDEEFNSLLPID